MAELIASGGLAKVARLDCCVSMVDCTTFMGDFDTTDFLTDRHGKEVDPEDERNITDLWVVPDANCPASGRGQEERVERCAGC
jgi:hypothetical protein